MFRSSYLFFLATSIGSGVYSKHFSVSPRVWSRISEVNQREGYNNGKRILRLAIESGGCHGYLYKFSFDDIERLDPVDDIKITGPSSSFGEEDSSSGSSGLELEDSMDPPQLVLDKHTLEKLQNATIDFHSELKGSAFVVVGNELVDQSCACAMSFSVRKKKSPCHDPQKSADMKKGNLSALSSRGTPIRRSG